MKNDLSSVSETPVTEEPQTSSVAPQNGQAPREASTNLFENLKYDAPAGLVVFLVALPLCLGVALASGAPLFSGIIAGICGGIIVTLFSGSSLSVSGPAAGLTAIVFTAIQDLHSYPAFLVAVVIAGALQIGLGLLKAGTIANYFPSSVIKGMLAAIGIILILKQIPHAVGYDTDFIGDFQFFEANDGNTFSNIFTALGHVSIGAAIISAVSLVVLTLWESPLFKPLRVVPGPLVVVLLGVGLNFLYRAVMSDWLLDSTDTVSHLVTLPVPKDVPSFLSQFTFPDFSLISGKVITVAITLAIVASIESLLSLEAVDKLDPFKRASPTNQELIAQGAGNIASGLIGGLPVTAVIVRSSANVNAGARTKVSAFLHGLFLLVSVIAIPAWLNQIPLASLAAVLLFTGYKLAKISLFKKMYAAGWDQFIPFVVTVVAILFTDLLKGIAVGMAVGVFYILRDHYLTSFAYEHERLLSGERIKITLAEHVSFLNKAQIHDALMRVPANSTVVIDGSESAYIDYDTLEVINDFKENAAYRNIQLELIGIAEVYKTDTHH